MENLLDRLGNVAIRRNSVTPIWQEKVEIELYLSDKEIDEIIKIFELCGWPPKEHKKVGTGTVS